MTDVNTVPDEEGSRRHFLRDKGSRRMLAFLALVVLGGGAFVLFSFSSDAPVSSQVATPGFPDSDPTQTEEIERSPTYRDNIAREADERAARAAASGQTTVAPFVGTPEPESTAQDDPEADQDPFARLAAEPQRSDTVPRQLARPIRQQPSSTQEPRLDTGLVQAASNVMGELIQLDRPRRSAGQSFVRVEPQAAPGTPATAPRPAEPGPPDVGGARPTEDEKPLVIATGSIAFAQVDVGVINTEPGPVRATLLSGPLRGSIVLGSFSEAYRSLVLRFDTLVLPTGKEHAINAIAVDPTTNRPGIVDNFDSQFWERVGLAFIARTIQGFGEVAAAVPSTVTTTGFGSVVTSNNEADTEEAIFGGIARGADVIAQDAERHASSLPEIKEVFAGREIGIIFLSAVRE